MPFGVYDRQGKPLTMDEWAKQMGAKTDLRRVARSTLTDGKVVSTVWLGLDHNFSRSGPPLIFETMVFDS